VNRIDTKAGIKSSDKKTMLRREMKRIRQAGILALCAIALMGPAAAAE